MNSLNAERAVSIRSISAIPALLLIFMSVHSSLAWIIHDFTGKKRKGALKD